MQPTLQATGAYLDGVAEGRRLLKANPQITLDDMEAYERAAGICMRRHSDAMRDCFKGERDFWRNQIKIKQENKP